MPLCTSPSHQTCTGNCCFLRSFRCWRTWHRGLRSMAPIENKHIKHVATCYRNLVTFPMTSRSGLFCVIFNTFAENDPFSCVFQLSYYRARLWTNCILYTPILTTSSIKILILSMTSLYTNLVKLSTNKFGQKLQFSVFWTKCNNFEVKYVTNWWQVRKIHCHAMKRIVPRSI